MEGDTPWARNTTPFQLSFTPSLKADFQGRAEHRKPYWPLHPEEVRCIFAVGLRIENGNSF